MKVSLLDVDGHNFPNFALMKLSAWHKRKGDEVEWYNPLFSRPDVLYASKVFVFTRDYAYFPHDCDVRKGGTGYDVTTRLPDEVEEMSPDYSIYPMYDFCIGFITRGCPNRCSWCVVPQKEGKVHVVPSIEKIAVRKKVVLMDNNFLAADDEFVCETLEKMARMPIRIDFNQALDHRRITPKNAALLKKCKWLDYIRFSCDTDSVMPTSERAIRLVREAGYKGRIFFYVLAKDEESTIRRIEFLDGFENVRTFVMPFRDLNEPNWEIDRRISKIAHWCNRTPLHKSVPLRQYLKEQFGK